MTRVAVLGASGYTGGEVLRLLLAHPAVEVVQATSDQFAGKRLDYPHPSLRGMSALRFVRHDALEPCDVLVSCMPQGGLIQRWARMRELAGRVIDLSADFRIAELATYEKYYGKHHAPELLASARFVLPELTPPTWKNEVKLVASPGCYPTSILTPLVPLLGAGVVSREHIVVNSYSGVSGAGKKLDEMYLYVERAESIKAYGLVKHRHLAEIEEQLALRSGAPAIIQFNPHLAPMRRGIATTITVPAAAGATIESLYAAWNQTYAGRTFVQILPSGETPDTAHVVGTNRVDMSAVFDPRTKNFVRRAKKPSSVSSTIAMPMKSAAVSKSARVE